MRRWGTPVLVLGLVLGSCGGGSQDRLAYELGEFFVSGPETIAHGTMEIPAMNAGEFPHTLVITTREGAVVAATDLIAPGVESVLTVDLSPGDYLFTCRIVAQKDDGSIVDHFAEGMSRPVTVAG